MCWVRVMRVSDGFPHACGLCVCGGAVYDVVMTEVFLRTTANKAGYVTVRVQNATGEVVLNGALSLMDRRVEMVPEADGVLGFEPLSNGTWLLEVRANGATVVYGKVLVLPSPIDAPPGNDSWEFVLDAAEGMALVDVVLNQGPRGYSAYDVAVMEGFVGTKAEWLEYMRQQTATLAVERVTPLMERAEAAAGDAEREAVAAKTAQESATAHAAAARESKLAAADKVTKAAAEVTKAAAEVEKAWQERETAAGHAAAAAKSAQDALANQQGAKQAAQDAAQAEVAATAAKNDADAAKLDAQTSERNAKGYANAAAADKVAAETAKTQAQAAQSKAEQEAQKAEQNAALLGDAALKSGDNVFSGLNTFSGDVVGVLPWDFHAYSWCETAAEFIAACPDLLTRESICLDVSSINGSPFWRCAAKSILLYYSGEINGPGRVSNSIERFALIAPNAKETNSLLISNELHTTKEVFVMLPKGTLRENFGSWGQFEKMYLVCRNKIVTFELLTNTYAYGWVFLKELHMPLNVVESIDLNRYRVLESVPFGFPYATHINFNNAKLNKPSVMAILNALLTYDAATMATVPELTLGIDPTLDGDEEINAALLNAQAAVEDGGKGWNVAVNGFTIVFDEAQPANLDEPVIFAQKKPDSDGCWVDANGERWTVRWGNVVTQNYQCNAQLGYTEFSSIETAVTTWGLTEYQPEEIS